MPLLQAADIGHGQREPFLLVVAERPGEVTSASHVIGVPWTALIRTSCENRSRCRRRLATEERARMRSRHERSASHPRLLRGRAHACMLHPPPRQRQALAARLKPDTAWLRYEKRSNLR